MNHPAFTNRVQSGSRLRPQRGAALLRRSCRLRRGLAAAIVSAVVISTTAGCGGDDGASALPPLDTTAATTSPSPTPTKDPNAWKSDYDEDQLRAYDDALAVWQKYEEKSEPIWAAGKVTDDAEKLFKKYWTTWQIPFYSILPDAERRGEQVFGLPTVLWSVPNRISLPQKGEELSTVTIRQCLDASDVRVEYGPNVQVQETGEGPRPFVRTITLVQRGERPWLIRGLADGTAQGEEIEWCDQ